MDPIQFTHQRKINYLFCKYDDFIMEFWYSRVLIIFRVGNKWPNFGKPKCLVFLSCESNIIFFFSNETEYYNQTSRQQDLEGKGKPSYDKNVSRMDCLTWLRCRRSLCSCLADEDDAVGRLAGPSLSLVGRIGNSRVYFG